MREYYSPRKNGDKIMQMALGNYISDHHSERGLLHVLEFSKLPFQPKRLYWIQDVPEFATRGAHGHKELQQAIWALKGECKIRIHDGNKWSEFTLKYGENMICIPPGCWRELRDFSSDCMVMIAASESYEESDYISDFSEFESWKNGRI
jgi:hypothetical protein